MIIVAILFVGVGGASAIGVITLAGNVLVTGTLDVSGPITGITISDLDSRIIALESEGCHIPQVLLGLDLSGLDFTGVNLSSCNFTGANLTGTDFTGANLSGATLFSANFFGANLDSTNLDGALIIGADFTECFGTPIGIPSGGPLPVCFT